MESQHGGMSIRFAGGWRWLPTATVLLALVCPATLSAQADDASPVVAAAPRVSMDIFIDDDRGTTSLGKVVIELREAAAPEHSASFLELAGSGFYNKTTFHRLVPGFIIQGGDPASRNDWRSPRLGTGGGELSIPAEVGLAPVRGAVVGARKAEGSTESGSQFFICLADLPSLEGYSVFGMVVDGMDVVDKIARIKNAGARNGNRALKRVVMKNVQVVE